MNSIQQIYKNSGLDYLGFDFAIMADKSIVIFEINPAQNPFIKLNEKDFPYMTIVRQNIIKSLGEAVANKIKNTRNRVTLAKAVAISKAKKVNS